MTFIESTTISNNKQQVTKDDKLWVTRIYIKVYGSKGHPDILFKGMWILTGHPKV